jgi:DNA replication and repair protein RecF
VRLEHLVARGFRNLADLELEPPAEGMVLLGANAQGKTNLLEAVCYPVLFRSFRGSTDPEIVRFGGPGFHVAAQVSCGAVGVVGATYHLSGRRKQLRVDGNEPERLADAVGGWVAVSFLPADVGLASGPAAGRRQYLDRLLSLADGRYLRSLMRYRAALAQRNSALRQGRPEMAQAFDGPLASAGADVVRAREAWARGAQERFAAEFECLGEREPARLYYGGQPGLDEPGTWRAALDSARPDDRARSMTTVGPHRDDLVLEIGGKPLRAFGSTGQQRSAAVALRLIEIATLREARDTEPGLLLDDVFAELDRERQRRLAARLLGSGDRQVFLTAPRADELPSDLKLPVWRVEGGRIGRA